MSVRNAQVDKRQFWQPCFLFRICQNVLEPPIHQRSVPVWSIVPVKSECDRADLLSDLKEAQTNRGLVHFSPTFYLPK